MIKRMFSLATALILMTSFLVTTTSIQATKTDEYNTSLFASREIILKLKPITSSRVKTSPEDSLSLGLDSSTLLNSEFGVVKIERLLATSSSPFANVYKLQFSHDIDMSYIIRKYSMDPNVEYAEPNYVGQSATTPNDAYYTYQWAHKRMESESAWNIQTGHSDVVIAIVDTGVDWSHPDLSANIWINSAELVNGVDDDGNGYVDDIRGWDFVDTTDPIWPGEDGTVRDNDPMDFDGHGTHVAGIAAGVTNNTIGIAGMSWNNRIMVVRAGYRNSDGEGVFSWSDVAPAIVYAADNGAKVISMSLGGYSYSRLLEDAVNYAYSKGVVLVAGAMNDNTDSIPYPAGYAHVIAVAATNNTDGKASFSNYGSWVDVSAPGVNIYSTMLDDRYVSRSGTSASTPYISGLAGLVISENATLTNEEVKNAICNTTDPVVSSKPMGTGRANARKAVLSVHALEEILNTNISKNGETYSIEVVSNTTVMDFKVTHGSIKFTVLGETETSGYVKTIQPVGLNSSDIKVILNITRLSFPSTDPLRSISTNSSHYIIYFEFTFSSVFCFTIAFPIEGDIDYDGYVNATDAYMLSKAFYLFEEYNPNADINGDGYCNAKDAVILGIHFNESWA